METVKILAPQFLVFGGYCWEVCASLFGGGQKDLVGEGDGTPLQYSCLANPMNGGAWWAAVYGVAQSRTQLKRLNNNNKDLVGRPASLGGVAQAD